MTTQSPKQTEQLPCFKLKGSTFAITTLQLLDNDLKFLASQIAEQVSKAPKFFDHTPIIIDCQIITDKPGPLDLLYLLDTLRAYNIIPIGLRGGRLEHQQQAIAAGLAIFPLNKSNHAEPDHPPKTTNTNHAPAKQAPTTKLIKHPIRSGQQVYAKGGDLIIIGAVSAGAECLADGNIHIYGPLRGRALAGVHGDTETHIFCTHLEAELVSVAGHYQVSETLKEGIWQSTANIYLQDEALQIVSL